MYTCRYCGLVSVFVAITILGVCVTEPSQTHNVVMCTRRNNTQCNLNAVNCGSGYAITIVLLKYRVISLDKYNTQCNNCPDCCKTNDWDNKETGQRLDNLKNACNDKQACVLNSDIMISSDGQWRAKIKYKCVPLPATTSTITTTTTTTVSTPTLLTNTTVITTTAAQPSIPTETTSTRPTTTKTSITQTSATTSVSLVTTTKTSLSKSTTETTGGKTNEQNHEDDFPTAAAVSVPLSLIVVGTVVFSVVWYLRKLGHNSRKADDVSKNVENDNNSNLIAMDNRAYDDHSVTGDHSYEYITTEHNLLETDGGYVETSECDRSSNGNYTNAQTVNALNHGNYGHVSRQPPAIDNTYSHITTKQPAKDNGNVNYAHIAGVQDLNHVEEIGADPSDDNDITYTFLSATDNTTMDGLIPSNINDEDDGYNHTRFVRPLEKTPSDVTEINNDDGDEYSHTNFENTRMNENNDEYDHTDRTGQSVIELDKQSNIGTMKTNQDDDERNQTCFARSPASNGDVNKQFGHATLSNTTGLPRVNNGGLNLIETSYNNTDTTDEYENISSVNTAASLRDNSKNEIESQNRIYSYAHENTVAPEMGTDEMIGIEQHDYFILDKKN